MSVCQDQQTFNKAFKQAIDDYGKDECTTTQCKVTMTVFVIIMLLFYIWAVILAMRVRDPEHRLLHIIFALGTGPIYVLSYYASGSQMKD